MRQRELQPRVREIMELAERFRYRINVVMVGSVEPHVFRCVSCDASAAMDECRLAEQALRENSREWRQ